ncbi:MAG: MarR family transcriptional regulator [Peptococcaceae bacterium]|nr:MarR family transcriptional regulator [Peptococcaceae bacterium]
MLYRCGQIFLGRELRSYSLGSGQYPFLLALYKNDGISQEELSDYLKIDKATTAKAIKKLADEGFVTRRTDNRDKRAYKLCLTDKALLLKPAMHAVASSWEQLLYTGLTAQERVQAEQLLGKMSGNTANVLRKEEIVCE